MSLGGLSLRTLLFSLTLLSLLGWAAIVNRTIDDSAGDAITGLKPEFLPANVSGLWKDQTCTDCRINPDVNRAFGTTYTAATYSSRLGRMSIEIPFNGTAIYIFFILANNAGTGITTRTECDFILDNGSPVHYLHTPNPRIHDILYNQAVFSRTGLPQRQHLLEVVTAGYDYRVYVAFDYAIYTYDDSPPSSSNTTAGAAGPSQPSDSNTGGDKKVPIGPIVGGVVGGILVAVGGFFLFFCLKRRSHQRKAAKYNNRPTPLMDELEPQNRVDPYIQNRPFHPGGTSSLGFGSRSEPLYSPVPQQTSHKAQGGYPPMHSSKQSASDYSSMYTGIATGGNVHPQDSDRMTTAAGSSSGGSMQHNASGSASATAPTSVATSMGAYPPEKGGRADLNALPPLAAGTSRSLRVSNPEEQEQMRQVRQAEIGERLRNVEAEMSDIKRGLSTRRPRRTDAQRDESADMIARMREQMAMMQEEIDTLRENQRSDWALGLTDEPPPGYTATAHTPR